MAEVEAVFPSADRHEVELRAMAELERLPGVSAAAVWLDNEGCVREVRIHVRPGAAPTIVSNAASHVLQTLGIPFDQRAIRTIQLPSEDDAFGVHRPTVGGRFLLLQDIALNRAGSHVTCRVQLAREDRIVAGETRELDTPAGRVRAAASATLRAAEEAAEGLALGLEGATLQQMFGRSYAAVCVEASVGRRIASLTAVVPVDAARTTEEAVCMATLRAIDRWIAL